jgi:predicted RNA binding protein YcfA (HicA-like mRNA interferase family)
MSSRMSYQEIIEALQRDGWIVVHQLGDHVRLQKRIDSLVLKLIVPAHRQVGFLTWRQILERRSSNKQG